MNSSLKFKLVPFNERALNFSPDSKRRTTSIIWTGTGESSLSKDVSASLRVIIYFPPSNPFPTEDFSQVSPYSIDISRESVQMNNITLVHQFKLPAKTRHDTHILANHSPPIRIPLMRRCKFHSSNLLCRCFTEQTP